MNRKCAAGPHGGEIPRTCSSTTSLLSYRSKSTNPPRQQSEVVARIAGNSPGVRNPNARERLLSGDIAYQDDIQSRHAAKDGIIRHERSEAFV